jgi:DNA-binding LacI/PurR family transcriptional regulator
MQAANFSKSDRVYDALAERIRDGTWPVDCVIPSEKDLSSEFFCSRSTIGKSVARLVHEGLVERKRRAGTRVVRTSPGGGRHAVELDAFAFIHPSQQHEGIRRIAQGFQEAAHAVQRRVVMVTTGMDFRKEGEIIGRLNEFDVKGAVVFPVLPEPQDRLDFEQMLLRCRYPVVLAAGLPGVGCPAVALDGFHAGLTMTRHLLGRGLKRIGFLSNVAWSPSTREKHLGYRQAMEEAGISIRPEWALLDHGLQPNFENPLSEGRLFTKQYLQSAVAGGLEGVLCGDDFLALVCLASARELGISVPDQLKVAGISDYAISAQSDPPLTTYHVPFEEIGRQSFQMLNCLLQGGIPAEREIQVRGSLVARQSG